MNGLYLVFPQAKHEALWRDIIAEYERAGEKVMTFGLKEEGGNYSDFLRKMMNYHAGRDVPPHHVPASMYFLMDESEGKILGTVNIRHALNAMLLETGGNIGYVIAPSERRKGYATALLSLALEKCRALGMAKVLVTCKKDNIGSAKTIINNGGILENEVLEENGNIIQRYWIAFPGQL
jgi:predicted acetyltransferase